MIRRPKKKTRHLLRRKKGGSLIGSLINTIGNALGSVAKHKDALKSVGEIASAAASAGKNTYDIVKSIKQKKMPDQNVVHQSDVQLQQQQALQQVIDRIRKLNTAAAPVGAAVGTGDKKSRQSSRRHPVNSGSSSRSRSATSFAAESPQW
jgi:hypothetical protein